MNAENASSTHVQLVEVARPTVIYHYQRDDFVGCDATGSHD